MINLLFVITTAMATGIHTSEVPCPIDSEDTVKLYFMVSSNEFGGYDSDGATYSSGTQFREYAISSCSQSLFSSYTTDMNQALSPKDIKEIQQWLPSITEHQTNPAVWDRYEIAAAFYQWQRNPPLFMGRLYLEAAWTVRDKAVGIHQGLNGPVVADQVLDQGKVELTKELTPEQRKMVTFNLARVAHRNARFADRQLYLEKFLNDPNIERWEVDAGKEFLMLTTKIEPLYLEKALSEYLQHLQNAPNDGQTLYLVGDLYRRLEDPTNSELYFKKANLTAHLQPEQRLIIEYLQKTLK